MALELVRDLIRIDQVMGEEVTQAMVEGDVVVPDSKPDVDKILSVNGWVVITDKEVVEDRIILEGAVNVKTLYISREGDQPLYYMEGSFGFTQQIELSGINSRMDAEVHAEIEHLDCTTVNSRKLNAKCVLNFSGKVVDRSQIDVIKDVKGVQDIQVLRDYVEVSDTIGENSSHATVRQEFQIPADQPAVKEILKTDVVIGEREERIAEDRLNVHGVLKITTLYVGEGEDSSINTVKYQIPFSHYVDIPGAIPGMSQRVKYSIEDFYSTVRENEEGLRRNIEYEVVVKAEGKVEAVQQMEILVDAYSPTVNLNVRKSSLKLKKTLDSIVEEIVVKEEIDLPGNCPGVVEVCDIEAVPVLTDFGISDDCIVIEGLLCVKVLYVTENYEYKLYLYEDEIPFRHTAELPEYGCQMDVDVDLYLEDFQYRTLSPDLLEIKGRVKVQANVSKSFSKEVLMDVEEAAEAEVRPGASIVVYVVQPGDTLWKVAKKYSTTIEELVKINELEEPDKLVPGQKLIISRTVKYQLS
ncbi:MAG: hypothetical protein HPY66_0437 [Firmicutes bacterium]|nr:hypothetical protein [Bacillota bacterium]MDI6705133.1 DUF3794 domain-containing protein [Bacillota bacterium]